MPSPSNRTRVRLPRRKLEQVVLNLVFNAVEAVEAGHPPEGGGKVVVTAASDGARPIPPLPDGARAPAAD